MFNFFKKNSKKLGSQATVDAMRRIEQASADRMNIAADLRKAAEKSSHDLFTLAQCDGKKDPILNAIFISLENLGNSCNKLEESNTTRLSYCQCNLLLVMKLSIMQTFLHICLAKIVGRDPRSIPPHDLEFIITIPNVENRLYSPSVANLFSKFFNATFNYYFEQMDSIVKSTIIDDYRKVDAILSYCIEFYSLIVMQVRGLNISCSIIKPSKGREDVTMCSTKHQSCVGEALESVILFITDVMCYNHSEIINDMLTAIKMLKPKQYFVTIDFTYVINNVKFKDCPYLTEIFKMRSNFAGLFFSNCDNIDFEGYERHAERMIIKNKQEWNAITTTWSMKREMPLYMNRKRFRELEEEFEESIRKSREED